MRPRSFLMFSKSASGTLPLVQATPCFERNALMRSPQMCQQSETKRNKENNSKHETWKKQEKKRTLVQAKALTL